MHANQVTDAVTLFLETVEKYGYNPIKSPQSSFGNMRELRPWRLFGLDSWKKVIVGTGKLEEQILLLICVIGPTLLSVDHEQTSAIFKLGVSLTGQVGRVLETSGVCLAL